jgi:4-amino-4-deoxy-L-arabinose transferase-like glycosyltransferase
VKPEKAAAVFVGATLGAGAWHVLFNAAPPSFDDGWYLETSFRLFNALKSGLPAFAAAYVSAFRIKAPLVSLLPLPLYALFGAGERVPLWANLMALGAACGAVFAAGRALWPSHPRRDGIAALAAALTALVPLLYGLSRVFFVEPILTALVVAAVWKIASARTGRRDGAALGALLGLGLLAKILFPLYLIGPAWLFRERLRPHAKTALFAGGALAATWYAFNLPYVLGFAWSAGFGRVASDYSASGGLAARVVTYCAALLGGALSWPLAAAMLAATLAAAAARPGRLDDGSLAALAWAAPLAVFALGVNGEIRFAAPALPAFCLLAARAAMSFGSARARASAAVLLVGAGSIVFVRQTFLVPAKDALPWCGAPSFDSGWDREALVAAAADGGATVAAIALEHPRLNANNLSSLAASRGLDLRFVSLGYAQASMEGALIRLKDKDADRLIVVTGVPGDRLPAFLNRANEGVAAALESGRLPARLRARVPLGAGVTAAVYGIGRGM